MAAIDDLTVYLGSTLAAHYEPAILNGALATEWADQRARIRPAYRVASLADWATMLAPLREAVCRRVARNLALRKLPLGITESEANSLRISGRDTEIRRLEAPYRRLVVG